MEDPRIISALFIFLKMAYYNVLINNWAYEAGAVAKILDLEDGALKEQRYYPFDLVH